MWLLLNNTLFKFLKNQVQAVSSSDRCAVNTGVDKIIRTPAHTLHMIYELDRVRLDKGFCLVNFILTQITNLPQTALRSVQHATPLILLMCLHSVSTVCWLCLSCVCKVSPLCLHCASTVQLFPLCFCSPASWRLQSRWFSTTSPGLWASEGRDDTNSEGQTGSVQLSGLIFASVFGGLCWFVVCVSFGGLWWLWPSRWRCSSGRFLLWSKNTFRCRRRTRTERDKPSCRTLWWPGQRRSWPTCHSDRTGRKTSPTDTTHTVTMILNHVKFYNIMFCVRVWPWSACRGFWTSPLDPWSENNRSQYSYRPPPAQGSSPTSSSHEPEQRGSERDRSEIQVRERETGQIDRQVRETYRLERER